MNPIVDGPGLQPDLAFLVGGGALGASIRAHDWADTPLGPPAEWPQPLKTLMGVMLAADQPMFVAWGAERVMLYNDAYATLLADRHPSALGRPFLDVWSEVRGDLTPLVDQVFAGDPVHMADITLFLDRPGRPREAHFAFSYTPVRDETGAVVGLFCPCTETTEQVLAERHRAKEAARQQQLLQQMPGFVAVLAGPDHVFDYVNDAYVAMSGARDFIGRSVREVLPELAGQGFYELLDQVYATGVPFSAQALPVRLAGEGDDRFIDLLYQPIRNDAGAVSGMFVGGYDVTERIRSEAALRAGDAQLREAGARFAAALSIARLGSFEWDVATDEVVLDERARAIFGFGPDEEIAAAALFARIDPADFPRVHAAARGSQETLSRLETAYRIVLPDGTRRDVVSISQTLPGPNGQAARLVGVFEDATELRRAETGRLALVELGDAIRDIEDPTDLSFAAAGILGRALNADRAGYATVDEAGETLQVARDWTGPGVGSLAGVLAARDYGGFVEGLHRGEPVVVGDAQLDKRGDALVLERTGARALVAVPLLDQGRLVAILFVDQASVREWHRDEVELVRQFAERIRAAVERIQNAASLRTLNETLEEQVAARTAERNQMWALSRDIMLRCGVDGGIRAVNPAWTEVLGWREDELVGRSLFDLIHPDDLRHTQQGARAHAEGRSYERFENRYRHKNGGYRWISWSTRADADVIVAVGRDVTADKERAAELEQAHEQLRQAQKMEAVGQLTGGIAHDFNNLLTGVIGSLDMMQRRMAKGETDRVERYVTAAMTSANRAAALTHRLLAFSRRQPLDPKPVNANRLVTGMEELLRRTIGEGVGLEIVTAGGLWQTLCDPHQLESAILNLAINARDAMPDGGQLTIETCNAHLDTAYAAQSREVRPGQYVCICVTDTGSGMDKDTIAKAFEPFFTTKPIGQGTGLGLSMIYGFARQSEGYAKIYSEPGQGTTVKLYLPRYYGEAEDAEEAAGELTDAHLADEGEVVLVVEDETAVRDLVTDLLGDLGYRAIEAADGPTGLKLLQSDMRVDLLVTDIGLPGLNGRQLADAARVGRPELRVLFMTGYAENATLANGFLEPGMEMITKPFAVEALATRIRDMLEGS